MHCLSSLDPTAPCSVLSVPMKVTADKTTIEVLIDTCSSLDIVDEKFAIDNHFEIKSVPKHSFKIAGGGSTCILSGITGFGQFAQILPRYCPI